MFGMQAAVEAARGDPALVVLEGVHALKHAVRFGATIERIASPAPADLAKMLAALAPDVEAPVQVEHIAAGSWNALTRGGLPSPAIALARRPEDRMDAVMAAGDGLVVALQDPTHLGNVGAAVRVAAATDADGVLTLGTADPWHPRAVRGAAGLQFALPVGRRADLTALDESTRPLVALDPGGTPLGTKTLPANAVVVFGTERHGLTAAALRRADAVVRLPMRAGVSSLNLATAVAAVLYGASKASD